MCLKKESIHQKMEPLHLEPVAGFTIELPMTSGGTTFGLDYSYRHTDPFQGSHSIGARINL